MCDLNVLLSDHHWDTSWQEHAAVLEFGSPTSDPGAPCDCVEVLSHRSQAAAWWTQQCQYLLNVASQITYTKCLLYVFNALLIRIHIFLVLVFAAKYNIATGLKTWHQKSAFVFFCFFLLLLFHQLLNCGNSGLIRFWAIQWAQKSISFFCY